MHTCPLRRASLEARTLTSAYGRTPPPRTGARRESAIAAIAANLAQWSGSRALSDLLNAIPDSNDDFGMF